MKPEDKYVALKVPKDLHIFLREKAKEVGMTLGNYLFDCICRVHDIKYIPASVEIPNKTTTPKELPSTDVGYEKPISEEIQVDIDEMVVDEQSVVEKSVIKEDEKLNQGG